MSAGFTENNNFRCRKIARGFGVQRTGWQRIVFAGIFLKGNCSDDRTENTAKYCFPYENSLIFIYLILLIHPSENSKNN